MIERPGSYNRLKSIVEYHRIGMLERIQIKGPISADIKVMVSGTEISSCQICL